MIHIYINTFTHTYNYIHTNKPLIFFTIASAITTSAKVPTIQFLYPGEAQEGNHPPSLYAFNHPCIIIPISIIYVHNMVYNIMYSAVFNRVSNKCNRVGSRAISRVSVVGKAI